MASSKQNLKDELSAELLKSATQSVRRKAFRKNLPVAILEDGKVVLVDKNNRKTVVADRS